VLLRAVGAGRSRRLHRWFAMNGAFCESLATRFVAGDSGKGWQRAKRGARRWS
jgi:hypothetical protein